ncbi:DUF1835 domain-containing protein [Pontibacter akesuensis]|uniref:DUF1835 domain-containing protein n=1 Tax=Pontibacter akesuensis TaxID=388950 RepID=A0A1I7GQX9_9BACT|nr:DUF1835 domain-containing protein [Pontibacter akesuensis]GHA55531.1 hypothetical protein GCM10007389_03760 [Pontibacter akesuensis]SFU50850.1 protein of unknown function [Pontibacter akesuensis]
MKKLPTLHILNGDASVAAFEKADLPGQVLVWREVLSEGPVTATLPEHEFWQQRQAYITSAYSEPANAYQEKVLDTVERLKTTGSAFFEIILWFDTDLMCQVNLLYLLQLVGTPKAGVVSVCTPAPGENVGLLPPDKLQKLMEERQVLQAEELKQARALWQLYTSPDPLELQAYLHQTTLALPYMRQALQLHLRRFPDCADGLSEHERALLHFVQAGAKTIEELMQQFWQHDPGYGFGDSQLHQLLDRLQPDLIQTTNPLKLSFFGDRVLQGRAMYKPKPHWLAAVKVNSKYGFCFNSETNSLQKKH